MKFFPDKDPPKTYGEICEYIARSGMLRYKDGSTVTAKQIWNSSPSGDLFPLMLWYEIAKSINDERNYLIAELMGPFPDEWPIDFNDARTADH